MLEDISITVIVGVSSCGGSLLFGSISFGVDWFLLCLRVVLLLAKLVHGPGIFLVVMFPQDWLTGGNYDTRPSQKVVWLSCDCWLMLLFLIHFVFVFVIFDDWSAIWTPSTFEMFQGWPQKPSYLNRILRPKRWKSCLYYPAKWEYRNGKLRECRVTRMGANPIFGWLQGKVWIAKAKSEIKRVFSKRVFPCFILIRGF